MARSWSVVAEPHRDLKVDLRDPQRGEDVRALQAACLRRLDARGIHRTFEIDGIFGPKTAAALDTAAHFLGALEETTERVVFPIGAQQLVRYPGRRNDQQLQRAGDRMERLRRDRARKEREERTADDAVGGVSGLPAHKRKEARRQAVAAFRLLFEHREAVHYTMLARRWDGINGGLRASKGEFPRYADCSSAYTWCLWNALTAVSVGHEDIVNGQGWRSGYTGTLLTHGREVTDLLPGDAIIYGHAWPGMHVAMYVGEGLVYSHGSEGGPYFIPMRYRSDILSMRRYI